MKINDLKNLKCGDKLYVLKELELYDCGDWYYNIYVYNDILVKEIKDEKVDVNNKKVIVANNKEISVYKLEDVYLDKAEAEKELKKRRKKDWKQNNLDEMLERLKDIKERLEEK